ncbi:MAG: hypothetical protein HGA96_16955 [Desulfobulbaceae bacterium]|nr:hypothetical protein [Desulfobulbaceae bacterium]
MEKQDRFRTIAEIASAVAHEVRNPLAGIKAISQVVEDRLPPDDNNRQHLAGIIAQVDRLNNLLNDFFSYAKPPKPKREPADLKEIVAKVLPLLQSRAGKSSIAIDCRLSGDLPRVVVDSGQIQQVFLNILINALDAVKPQGSIVIDAEFIGPASPEYQRRFPGLSEVEPYLLARISDSGVGMAGEILEKICEPFYTTKSTGTGLGLAIVTRILKEHGAALYAESLLGQGSTFFLFFKTK